MKTICSIEFYAGSGGMVNSNVLHMTKALSQTEHTIQLLHIFDVSLLSGEPHTGKNIGAYLSGLPAFKYGVWV